MKTLGEGSVSNGKLTTPDTAAPELSPSPSESPIVPSCEREGELLLGFGSSVQRALWFPHVTTPIPFRGSLDGGQLLSISSLSEMRATLTLESDTNAEHAATLPSADSSNCCWQSLGTGPASALSPPVREPVSSADTGHRQDSGQPSLGQESSEAKDKEPITTMREEQLPLQDGTADLAERTQQPGSLQASANNSGGPQSAGPRMDALASSSSVGVTGREHAVGELFMRVAQLEGSAGHIEALSSGLPVHPAAGPSSDRPQSLQQNPTFLASSSAPATTATHQTQDVQKAAGDASLAAKAPAAGSAEGNPSVATAPQAGPSMRYSNPAPAQKASRAPPAEELPENCPATANTASTPSAAQQKKAAPRRPSAPLAGPASASRPKTPMVAQSSPRQRKASGQVRGPASGPLRTSREDLTPQKGSEALQKVLHSTPPAGDAQGQLRASSHREAHMAEQVEAMRAKLQAAEDARGEAVRGLAEVRRDAERERRRAREAAEARAVHLQKEINDLRMQLAEAGGEGAKGRLQSGATEVVLSGAELAALRREMAEQEQIIRGYQAENEAAVEKLREAKRETAAREAAIAEEHARLERMVTQLQEQRRDTGGANAERLAAVLRLEGELAAARDAAAAREAELAGELEAARREKKALEARFAGLDLPAMEAADAVVKRVQAEADAAVAVLRREMEAMAAAHSGVVAQLEARLAWFAETQEAVTANDELIRQQANAIVALEERLRGPGADGPSGDRTLRRRTQELESEVATLKAALQQRHPESTPALLVAAAQLPAGGGAGAPDARQVAELQAKLSQLHGALAAREAEWERRLAALRQEHERLRVQYAATRRGQPQGGTRAGNRVKELEQQLEEVRGMYSKKVRGLEARLQEAEKQLVAKRTKEASTPPPGSGTHQQLAQLRSRVKQAESETAALSAKLAEAEAAVAQRAPSDARKLASRELAAEVDRLNAERDALHRELEAAQAATEQLKAEAGALARRVRAAEEALLALQATRGQEAARLQEEHQCQLWAVFEQHNSQLAAATQQAASAVAQQWAGRLAAVEAEMQASRAELAAARTGQPWTPSAAEVAILEAKFAQLEAAAGAGVLGQPAAHLQVDVELERMLKMKSAEVERFRVELDAILSTALSLQLASSR